MIESAYIIKFKQDDSWLDSSPKHYYGSEKVLFSLIEDCQLSRLSNPHQVIRRVA